MWTLMAFEVWWFDIFDNFGLVKPNNKPPTIGKQNDYLIHTDEADVSRSCAHVRIFYAHDVFYSQLHAVFGAYN